MDSLIDELICKKRCRESSNAEINRDLMRFVLKKSDGNNPKYYCNKCNDYSNGIAGRQRFIEHLEKFHYSDEEVIHFLDNHPCVTKEVKIMQSIKSKLPIRHASTDLNDQLAQLSSANRLNEESLAPPTITKEKLKDIQVLINEELATYCVNGGHPYAICEDAGLLEFLEKFGQLAQQLPKHVNIKSLIYKRTQFTEITNKKCNEIYTLKKEKVFNDSLAYGASYIIDGKSDFFNSPLLFSGIDVKGSFLWTSAFNPGSEKKDSTFMKELIVTNTSEGEKDVSNTFARNLFSVMQDNNYACQAAGSLAEFEANLVSLNCTTHSIALLPTTLFHHVEAFGDILDKVETIISFYRKKSRVSQILIESSGNKRPSRLLRIIPCRMMSSYFCLERICYLRPQLFESLTSDSMKRYINEADATTKTLYNKVKGYLTDLSFWSYVEFILVVLKPSVSLLKHFDQSGSRSCEVHRGWIALSKHLGAAMGDQKFDHINFNIKQQVMLVLEHVWTAHECDGHIASFILNPCLHDAVVKISLSTNKEEQHEWIKYMTATKKTIKTIIQRKASFNNTINVEEEYKDCLVELENYISNITTTPYEISTMSKQEPTQWWNAQIKTTFTMAATIITAFPATSSDLERSMKINNIIHSKIRANLTHSNVITLTRGYFASFDHKPKSISERNIFWNKFESLTLENANALFDWYELSQNNGLMALHTKDLNKQMNDSSSSQYSSTDVDNQPFDDTIENNLEDISWRSYTKSQEQSSSQNLLNTRPQRNTSKFQSLLAKIASGKANIS